MSRLKIGALFAGYGGLELATSAVLDTEPVWVVEKYPPAVAVLAARFPGVPNHGDITTIDWTAVEPVDVLTGGFPCQDVSSAGKRRGMRPDTRSGLWAQFAYAIDQLRPSLVVIENVRGLLSTPAHGDLEPCPICVGDDPGRYVRALGTVLGDLANLGYDAQWQGVFASDIGAPHGRFRVFIVAHPAGRDWRPRYAPLLSPLRNLPTPLAMDGRHKTTGMHRRRAQGHEVDLSHVIVTLTGQDPDELELLPTPAVNDMGDGQSIDWWEDWTADLMTRFDNGNGHGKSLSIEAQRLAERMLPTPTARESKGHDAPGRTGGSSLTHIVEHDGELLPTPVTTDAHDARRAGLAPGSHPGETLHDAVDKILPTPMAQQRGQTTGSGKFTNDNLIDVANKDAWGDYGPAVRRWTSLLGRTPPPPAIPTGTGKQQLSPRFVEWMMGLPDGWVTDIPGLTRAQQLTMLGNGIVPQQAAAALTLLLRED